MDRQGMTYTPSYANDEHRRIAAAALRLDAARDSPDSSVPRHVERPKAAFVLEAGPLPGADADADEDWRHIAVHAKSAASSRASRESSLRHHASSHGRHSRQYHCRLDEPRERDIEECVDDELDDADDADDDDDEDCASHQNAFIIMLRISFYLPPFTLFAALYALLSLIFLIFAIPIRICPPSQFFRSQTSLPDQICRLLVPLLRMSRQIVSTCRHSTSSKHDRARRYHTSTSTSTVASPRHSYIPPPPPTTTTLPTISPIPTISCPYAGYSALRLVAVHLLSPLLMFPTLLAVWICACFWIFVMIMGNPDGKEKTDDGRAAVLAVRKWWCLWLASAKRRRRSSHPAVPEGG